MTLTTGFTLGLPATPSAPSSIEYLLVGGGGSGSSSPNIGSGGGGAGGLVTNTGYAVTTTMTYTVTIGAGGAGLAVNAGGGTQGGSSQISSSFSGSFNGSSQYLTVASASPLQFGTGDFTVECWTYLTARTSTYPIIFSNYNSFTSGSLALFAGHGSATTTAYQVAINGTFPAIQSGTIAYNTWVHLAVVRYNGIVTLYINGVSAGTSDMTGVSLNGVGSNWYIGTGGDLTSVEYINGNISNLRVVKGVAVYTGNFTPPTSNLTATQSSGTNISAITGTQTSLLTLQNSTIVDNSTYAFAITNNGTVTTSAGPFGSVIALGGGIGTYYPGPGGVYVNASSGGSGGGAGWNGADVTHPGAALQPSSASGGLGYAGGNGGNYSGGGGGGAGAAGVTAISNDGGAGGAGTSTTFVPNYSISFNGSSQYLSVPSSSAFAFSGDFTVESWVYLTSGSTYQFLMGSSSTGGMMIGLNVPISGTPTIAVGTHNVAWVLNFGSSISIPTATWCHIAITRSGSTNRAFINGVQLGSNITDSTSWAFTSNSPFIATNALSNFFGGNISNLRIVNGVAVYTSNFTAPTGPLSIIQSSNQNGSPSTAINLITSTSLMLNTVNNSDYLTDSSSYKNTVTAVASPTSSADNPF